MKVTPSSANSSLERDDAFGQRARAQSASQPVPLRSGGINPIAAASLPARLRRWEVQRRGSFLPNLLITLLIIIMVVPQGLDYSLAGSMPDGSDVMSTGVWLMLMAGGFYLLASNGAKTLAFLKAMNPYLLVFAALATASMLWSIDPAVTLRRLNRLYTVTALCIGFTLVAWHPKRFQTMMRTVLTMILIASFIFCLARPDLAIHHVEGHPELMNAWHGITTAKNVMGSLASTALLLWLHGWLSKEVARPYALVGMAFSAYCLLMTRSSTSLMATLFAALLMLIMLRSPGSLRRYLPYFVGIFAAMILIYAGAVLNLVPGSGLLLKPITLITGKDLTFTGRTDIWNILNAHIRDHPFLGTGYGAYWVGPYPSSPSFEMVTRLYFYPTEGHNGYLDIVNDLGLAGAVVLLLYFRDYLRQSLLLLRMDRYQAGLYICLIFRGFVADMSESHWLSVISVDFVIMTLATTCLTRGILLAKLQRARAKLAA